MRFQDLTAVFEVSDEKALESLLSRRFGGGVNSFKLSQGSSEYPMLLVLINGDLASLHYFPRDRHPGFRSISGVDGLDVNGSTVFFMNSLDQEEPVLNDGVVPLATGMKAAREFFASPELPRSVEWLEL